MRDFNLLSSGLYVIISVEEEVNSKSSEYLRNQYQTLEIESDEFDLLNLFIITHSPPKNANFDSFKAKVLEKNKSKFGVRSHKTVNFRVPIHAGFAYDAVIVLAKAFDKIIKNNGSVYDGRAVIDAIRGSNYESILGYNVHIDKNLDAEGNYTLLAVRIANRSIDLKTVGTFQKTQIEQDDQSQQDKVPVSFANFHMLSIVICLHWFLHTQRH